MTRLARAGQAKQSAWRRAHSSSTDGLVSVASTAGRWPSLQLTLLWNASASWHTAAVSFERDVLASHIIKPNTPLPQWRG